MSAGPTPPETPPTTEARPDSYDALGGLPDGDDWTQEWLSGRFDVAKLEIDAREAARGTTRRVRVPVRSCPACGGTGAAAGSSAEECAACGGDGRVTSSPDAGSGLVTEKDTCPECNGSGRLLIVPCGRCLGSGRVKGSRTVAVRVPPGAQDGLAVLAEVDGRGGSSGAGERDVYVVIRVQAERDPRLIRYASAVALVVAVFLFVVLAVAPEAFFGGR